MKITVMTAALLAVFAAAAAAAEPRIARENIEWCDVWITAGDGHSPRPRVLLVGDSITRSYSAEVGNLLKDKADVSRLATSKCLCDPVLAEELALVLKQYTFDVVHFNNGLHGWDYTEAEYAAAFPAFVETIRKLAPGAKLIWTTTTPMREAGNLQAVSPRTDRVKARNKIAKETVERQSLPTDDLFTLVDKHPEYYSNDGTHLNPSGVKLAAAQVAQSILGVLPKEPK